MNVKQQIEWAMRIAQADECTPEDWNKAEKILLDSKLCPNCAQEGFKEKLGHFEPGNAFEYAGRECPSCEEFFPARQQQECYETEDYGGALGADGQIYSDSLPGF